MAPSSIPMAVRQRQGTMRWRPKYRSMKEIARVAKRVVLLDSNNEAENCGGGGGGDDGDYYSRAACDKCGSGDYADELLLCDKCDKAYHTRCVRPIMARVPNGPWFCRACTGEHDLPLKYFTKKKIVEFFRIQKCVESSVNRGSLQDAKKHRRRSRALVLHKKRRRLLPYVPTEDPSRRMFQLGSLLEALNAHGMEFSNDLNYMPGKVDRSANQAIFEKGGMQVLPKEDIKTLEYCKVMYKRGEYPPLVVVYDDLEGYTVEADGPIKDLTLITEYAGDVDYLKNREQDDSDSLMTLLLANDPSKSLVICPDKHRNIASYVSGINNHTPEGRKKQNTKCVRYNVKGECKVLLVANRDIAKGERLYYDYNGYEHAYPTHNFV